MMITMLILVTTMATTMMRKQRRIGAEWVRPRARQTPQRLRPSTRQHPVALREVVPAALAGRIGIIDELKGADSKGTVPGVEHGPTIAEYSPSPQPKFGRIRSNFADSKVGRILAGFSQLFHVELGQLWSNSAHICSNSVPVWPTPANFGGHRRNLCRSLSIFSWVVSCHVFGTLKAHLAISAPPFAACPSVAHPLRRRSRRCEARCGTTSRASAWSSRGRLCLGGGAELLGLRRTDGVAQTRASGSKPPLVRLAGIPGEMTPLALPISLSWPSLLGGGPP